MNYVCFLSYYTALASQRAARHALMLSAEGNKHFKNGKRTPRTRGDSEREKHRLDIYERFGVCSAMNEKISMVLSVPSISLGRTAGRLLNAFCQIPKYTMRLCDT